MDSQANFLKNLNNDRFKDILKSKDSPENLNIFIVSTKNLVGSLSFTRNFDIFSFTRKKNFNKTSP